MLCFFYDALVLSHRNSSISMQFTWVWSHIWYLLCIAKYLIISFVFFFSSHSDSKAQSSNNSLNVLKCVRKIIWIKILWMKWEKKWIILFWRQWIQRRQTLEILEMHIWQYDAIIPAMIHQLGTLLSTRSMKWSIKIWNLHVFPWDRSK